MAFSSRMAGAASYSPTTFQTLGLAGASRQTFSLNTSSQLISGKLLRATHWFSATRSTSVTGSLGLQTQDLIGWTTAATRHPGAVSRSQFVTLTASVEKQPL